MAIRSRLRNWGLLIFCNLIWGCQFVIYKIVQQQSGPVFAALFPIAIATLLMVPIVWRQHQKVAPDARRGSLPTRDVLQFLLIGICGQVVAQLGVATSARLILASNAALLGLALPIMTALMAYIFLDERMTPVRWVSFVLAVAGVLVCAGIRWGELSFTSTRYLLGNAILFDAVAQGLPDQLQAQLRLGPKRYRWGHARLGTPLLVLGPTLGQIEPAPHRRRHPAVAHHQFHAYVAVGLLAHGPAVLVADPHRVLPLFGPSGFLHHPDFQRLQMRNHFLPDRSPDSLRTPRAARHQLLQALRVHPYARRQGFDRLALSWHQQAFHVMAGGPPSFALSEGGDQRGHESRELRNAALPKSGIPLHASTTYTLEEGKLKKYLTE